MDDAAIQQAIWRLKAESFLALDEKRWDDFAACFTEDARIAYSKASTEPIPPIPSIPAYIDFARAFIGAAKTVHQGATPIIDIVSPKRAKAVWRMEDVIIYPPESGVPSRHDFGIYNDEYVRTKAGWRISALSFTLLLCLPIPSL